MRNWLKSIKNIIRWIPILWKDRDWDYAFMLEMEQQKLKNMCKWYETHNFGITVDGKRNYRDIKICVSLLDIILEKDDWWDIKTTIKFDNNHKLDMKDTLYIFKKYVNLRTWYRFYPKSMYELIHRHPNTFKIDLRVEKAWRLYNKIRQERLRDFWD